MNLITDSLPAIAIGMEASRNDVLKEKPRNANDSILNKPTFLQIGFEGIVIALCTMCSYLMGLKGDPLTASTMAFATICLARLLHGFNCRSDQPLTKIGVFSNRSKRWCIYYWFYIVTFDFIYTCFASLFMIHSISVIQLLCIYGFALIPTLIIQARKMLVK